MGNKAHDAVDALLDRALSSYADAEPLNGLEQRILNRASRARPGMRLRYGSLLAIGATLALSCCFILTFHQTKSEPKKPPLPIARVESPIPARITLPPPRQTRVRHRRLVQRLPKREVFPTPQPPSAEERALLRFVGRDPKEAAEAFASLQRQMDAPLEIAPIEIKPLQTDEINN
jgi:hypothetical protein